MKNQNLYEKCNLCPRSCQSDRLHGETGVCGTDSTLRIARAALHFWEEPCISGTKGSGAVFFSGCALHCVFCQNEPIARGMAGKLVPSGRLSEIFLELQEKGQVADLEKIAADIADRDYRDMHRETSPLKQAEDAVLLDSSDLDIDGVVAAMEKIIEGA